MKTKNVIHIKGNHELFLQQYLEGDSEIIVKYPQYGGIPVINGMKSMSDKRKENYHT
jgi:metallophosphoesterase superfamily enzyme